ncbi:MAG: hypothetical protein J1F32_05910 [Erysipelotrichales bacterium]|nr:hypothetical protein [Erysipelotrichales bacterium]
MNKKLLGIRLCQLILATVISFVAITFGEINEDGLILNGFLQFIPSILGSLIVLFAISELIYTRPIGRWVYLGIGIITTVILTQEGFVLVNASIWLFAFIYIILMIISVLRVNKVPTKKKAFERKGFTLPFGFYTTKGFIVFFAIVLVFCIPLGIGVYKLISCIFADSSLEGLGKYFLVSSLLLVIACVVYGFKNKLTQILIKFSKTADYEQFMLETNEILKNNLHEESIKYLKLLQVNYSFIVNKDQALNMFEVIDVPSNKSSLKLYKTIEILYYINKEEYQRADELIEEFQKYYKENDKQLLNMKDMLIIFSSNEEIEYIEKKYPMNSTKLINLINASTLLTYYKKRGDITKANFYAYYILNNTTQFKEIIKEAEEVIKSENSQN